MTHSQNYIDETFGLTDHDLRRIRERMHRSEKDFMSISGGEARILRFLIQALGLKKIVEVGTLYGYSGLAMAQVLPEEGELITLENDPEHYAVARDFFKSSPVKHKIAAIFGDANQELEKIVERGPFDMVFIDANKSGYIDYLNWAEQNVRQGGLIVGDNTFLFGAFWDEAERSKHSAKQIQVMLEFNARLADAAKYNSTLIPTGEGLTVAQKL